MARCADCGHVNGELEDKCIKCGMSLEDVDVTPNWENTDAEGTTARKLKAQHSHGEAPARKVAAACTVPVPDELSGVMPATQQRELPVNFLFVFVFAALNRVR